MCRHLSAVAISKWGKMGLKKRLGKKGKGKRERKEGGEERKRTSSGWHDYSAKSKSGEQKNLLGPIMNLWSNVHAASDLTCARATPTAQAQTRKVSATAV